jgi:hypothetical protein
VRLAALALLLPAGLLLGAPQAPPRATPPAPVDLSAQKASRYGKPETVPLREILNYPDRYQRRTVRTQGVLDLGLSEDDYRLREGHGAEDVLLLPVVADSDVRILLGQPVEVVGVVRQLRPKQYVRGVDLDKLEDPELPVMPAPDSRLPRISISFTSIFDATPLSHPADDSGGPFALSEATRERTLRVVGQFRGANLFADLPDLAGRDADAFVLKQGENAVWVIGKPAAGKGFHLDPLLRGDTRFWLEVEGRLEACGQQTCLRARRIAMAARPAPSED